MTERKKLLMLDKGDYDETMPVFERKCVRAIIEKNGKIAVQRGCAGDCKILGGGMDGADIVRAFTIASLASAVSFLHSLKRWIKNTE